MRQLLAELDALASRRDRQNRQAEATLLDVARFRLAAERWVVPEHPDPFKAGQKCPGGGKEAPVQSLSDLPGGGGAKMGKCPSCQKAVRVTRTGDGPEAPQAQQPAPKAPGSDATPASAPEAGNPFRPADHLAPGTVLRRTDSGAVATIQSFEEGFYVLSDGEKITDAELDQLVKDGKLQVLSPEQQAAVDAVLDVAAELERSGQADLAEMVFGATAEFLRTAASYEGFDEQRSVSLIPHENSVVLPSRYKKIVEEYAGSENYVAYKTPKGYRVRFTSVVPPSALQSIIQDATNDGLCASPGETSAGWREIELGKYEEPEPVETLPPENVARE